MEWRRDDGELAAGEKRMAVPCAHTPEPGVQKGTWFDRLSGMRRQGNPDAFDELVMDLECIETDYQSIKSQRKAVGELEVRIRSNAWMIPNCAERRRYGGR